MEMEVKQGNKATSWQRTKRIEGKNFGDSSDCTNGYVGNKSHVFSHGSDICIKGLRNSFTSILRISVFVLSVSSQQNVL
jgi:hypothetical protein